MPVLCMPMPCIPVPCQISLGPSGAMPVLCAVSTLVYHGIAQDNRNRQVVNGNPRKSCTVYQRVCIVKLTLNQRVRGSSPWWRTNAKARRSMTYGLFSCAARTGQVARCSAGAARQGKARGAWRGRGGKSLDRQRRRPRAKQRRIYHECEKKCPHAPASGRGPLGGPLARGRVNVVPPRAAPGRPRWACGSRRAGGQPLAAPAILSTSDERVLKCTFRSP
jgi:hypothetical protein